MKRFSYIYKNYGATIGLVGAILYAFAYSLLVALVNPVPDEYQLIQVSAKILRASQNHPNFILQLSDGAVISADFPENLFGYSVGMPRSNAIDSPKLAKLQGHIVQLKGEYLRLTMKSTFRIWELSSDQINFSYQQSTSYFYKYGRFNWINCMGYAFVILLLIFCFRFEKRNAK